MIVRVQSRAGTRRLTAPASLTLQQFLELVVREFGLEQSNEFSLFRAPGRRDELTRAHLSSPLENIPICHGDMLYLVDSVGGLVADNTVKEVPATEAPPTSGVEEDEVDRILAQRDGKVYRKKDPQLCHHANHSKCLNCAPLEPWDRKVQESRDPPTKHLSFHCHTRKLTSGADRGKFAYMEDLSCRVKEGCRTHPPWPAGICTQCQPSAVTLARQPYRHVDNIMFEDSKIVDRFLDGWRRSGMQRIGFLYGSYEEFDDVPLGIKAVVTAIYEPPQVCSHFSVELLEDPRQKDVDRLASMLGLRRVGWVFTDLEPEQNGRVAYKRNVHSHLLSAEECIMAADFQNLQPNPSRLSWTGAWGSKFVTICVSGNEDNQVHLSGYQVSNQCMALVRDNCLVPCLDAPELGFVRESSSEQYVPDVFYKAKGEYGADVTKLARPLPLEYLIIELTTTTPRQPKKPYLAGGKEPAFPVENREAIGQQHQDFSALAGYMGGQTGGDFLSAVSDFHLLFFLLTSDVTGLRPHLPALCQAVRDRSRAQAEQWRRADWWATVEQLILASAPSPTTSPLSPPSFPPPSSEGGWACKHCTLLNDAALRECNACNLPRD